MVSLTIRLTKPGGNAEASGGARPAPPAPPSTAATPATTAAPHSADSQPPPPQPPAGGSTVPHGSVFTPVSNPKPTSHDSGHRAGEAAPGTAGERSEAATGTAGAAPGSGGGLARAPSRSQAPHLELRVAKGAGKVGTVTGVDIVGIKGSRKTGQKVHFCVQCRAPIAIFGVLQPCRHTFCLTCASADNKCPKCEVAVTWVEEIDYREQRCFPCGVPSCVQGFKDHKALVTHVYTDHRSLASAEAIEAAVRSALSNSMEGLGAAPNPHDAPPALHDETQDAHASRAEGTEQPGTAGSHPHHAAATSDVHGGVWSNGPQLVPGAPPPLPPGPPPQAIQQTMAGDSAAYQHAGSAAGAGPGQAVLHPVPPSYPPPPEMAYHGQGQVPQPVSGPPGIPPSPNMPAPPQTNSADAPPYGGDAGPHPMAWSYGGGPGIAPGPGAGPMGPSSGPAPSPGSWGPPGPMDYGGPPGQGGGMDGYHSMDWQGPGMQPPYPGMPPYQGQPMGPYGPPGGMSEPDSYNAWSPRPPMQGPPGSYGPGTWGPPPPQ